MSELRRITLIVVLVIAFIGLLTAFLPGMIGLNPLWGGADTAAVNKIIEISDYKPWFSPIWKPPSCEIETLLFSVQSAIGAGIIGYIAGLYAGRKKATR